ncbi:MAG: anthranilate synthase component I family protein [Phycisphaerales bacterium]|nr:anthranilate synthase component I family protein [Phycisphaerales bacterium]
MKLDDLLSRWPGDAPLALLASHGGGPFGRISLAAAPSERVEFRGPRAFEEFGEAISQAPALPHASADLTGHGWFMVLGYELGRQIEPAVTGHGTPVDDRSWPEADLLRCEGMLCSRDEGPWELLGNPGAVPDLGLPRALPVTAGPIQPGMDRRAYEAIVSKVVDLIHAGDCFQANLAHRFHCTLDGSVRAVARAAFDAAGPRYGALVETAPGRAVISMSPELFLEVRGTGGNRIIRTRPVKGTRPDSVSPEVLRTSSKDEAELAMIVDLMRNDLGRVCDLGSIQVSHDRTIETHRTVHHGVAEVQGNLRSDATMGDILAATFPPGSVTGAPKVRAMQIIESLEPVRRGPYCGAIGWLDDSGLLVLNVAIRTIAASGAPGEDMDQVTGHMDYLAGCGIVAESEPDVEYEESLAKAVVFQRTLNMLAHATT